jgi:hypothetical protein
MTVVREAWTDERLDDFAKRVDQRFDRVEADLRELRTEMNLRFDAVDARFDAMQRTMILGFSGISVGFLGVIGSLLATQL